MALHFTKQQIDEIEQALIARAKKDTSFPGADILDGTELIPIVQNGVNKITTYAGLWNQVSKDLQEFVENALAGKVDVVEGKELSDNNYTSEEKDKLAGIAVGANVNVQADWEASIGDAFIKNKPDLNIYATQATVQDIQALIPTAATTSNQLADKAFVNSSIATDTSEFRGTFNTLAELMTVAADKNDYGFVRTTDDLGNTVFQRYKYNGETWLYEYSLNNSSFTAVQWTAINSGINSERVAKLDAVASGAQVNVIEGVQVDSVDLTVTNKKVNIDLSGKVDKVSGKGLSTNDYTTNEKTKLGELPTNGELNAALSDKANKNEMSVVDGADSDADKTTITLKTGTAATVLKSHQDISGKAEKSEMSVSSSGDKTTITLKSGLSTQVLNAHQSLTSITEKIPNEASSSNQLADKEFVNSSISTATANYRGSKNLVSDLNLSVSATEQQIATALLTALASPAPNNNDYAFVQVPTADATPTQISRVDRYKFNGTAWSYEFSLNNSGYTAEQWAAINSGIASGLVTKLSDLYTKSELDTLFNSKADKSEMSVVDGEGANADKTTITLKSGTYATVLKSHQDISGKVDKINGKQLSTEDYTTAEKEKLGAIESGAQVNDIEHIKIGDTEQTISEKTVSLPASYPKADLADIAVNNKTELKSNQEFVFRKTNCDWNANTEMVKSLKGKSLVWNQLLRISSTDTSKTENGVTFVDNRDGSYTVSTIAEGATAGTSLIIRSSIISGHKYLLKGCPTGGTNSTYRLYFTSSYATDIADYGNGAIGQSITTDSNAAGPRIAIIEGCVITTPITFVPQLFDLTLMFGAGNEPSTAEEFEALYHEAYYDYNEGTIVSSDAEALESVGRNLWDEEWELGGYNNNTGAKDSATDRIRSKNAIPIFPNTTYYFYGSGATIFIYWYDASGSFISYSSRANDTLTSPSNAYFMRFRMASGYGTTYNHDICINLSDPSKNGTYEPYRKSTIQLNLGSFQVRDSQGNVTTITGGLKSAGSVYDEIVGNKYIKRVGSVDLGSLTYQYDSSSVRFVVNISSCGVKIVSSWNGAGSICEKYVVKNVSSDGTGGDKIFGLYAQKGYIRDTSYNDGVAFKTAMSGVKLYYELATPIEYELVEPIPTLTTCSMYGTERIIYPESASPSAPFKADIQYGSNNDEQTDNTNNVVARYDAQTSPVIASAFAKLQSEFDAMKVMLADYQTNIKTASIDSMEYRIGGMPYILYSSAAGAPSASNVPLNWDESTMQAWSGVPRFVGQIYVDQSSNKKVYFAVTVTNSTSDWVALN